MELHYQLLRNLRQQIQSPTSTTATHHQPLKCLTSRHLVAFSSKSGRLYSHDNPLGLPPKNRIIANQNINTGIPSSNSPPKLNISRGIPKKRKIPNVRKVLVVASGKGGVGKSTVAVNLAISIKNQSKLRVGLLDLDIFGPSVPKLMGLDDGLSPELTDENALVPLRNHGISCMSIGFLIPSSKDADQMIAWRGMMVMKAVQQLLFDVDWRNRSESDQSDLDILVIDMPPGTGDVALSLGQLVEIDGAVIVTTPQDIALIDVTKGVNMFRKLDIPIIGSIVNMSSFKCTSCNKNHEIFGSLQNFNRILTQLSIQVLGQIPLDFKISKFSDLGKPISIFDNFKPSERNDLVDHGDQPTYHSDHQPNTENAPQKAQDQAVNPFHGISKKCLDHLSVRN